MTEAPMNPARQRHVVSVLNALGLCLLDVPEEPPKGNRTYYAISLLEDVVAEAWGRLLSKTDPKERELFARRWTKALRRRLK
jgi:hypothetical protein